MKNFLVFLLFAENISFVIFSTYNYAQYNVKGNPPEPIVWLWALGIALIQLTTLLISVLIGNKKRTRRRPK